MKSIRKQFGYYKLLGERTIAQLDDKALFWQYNEASNSIAIIVKHLWGNMLSRWTDFLTTDGEKEWRNREAEFEADIQSRKELLEKWNEGWACLFTALDSIDENKLDTIVYIRNMGHTVSEAINRQLAHYAYHIGQIVYIGRMVQSADWQSLSIPKGGTEAYNQAKFEKPKHREHFMDEPIVILETARLQLVEFSIKDAADFFQMNNDPQVLRYTGDQPFRNIEDAQAFIQSYDHYQKYGYGRWTIRRKSDNAYLGFCGLKYHPDTKEVDLGYRLCRKYWGKGYATEAAQACLGYGLEKRKLDRIIGRAVLENKASVSVLAKIGMKFLKEFDFDGQQGVIYEKNK